MSKSMVRLSRGMVAVVAAAVALSSMALPAYGKAAPATASINVNNVLAGSAEELFRITVNNPPNSGTGVAPPVNLVQVLPPNMFTGVDAVPPEGWTGYVDAFSGQVIFEAENLQSRIPPGGRKSFEFTANVARPVRDITRTWRVSTSDDSGRTTTSASPTSQGALNTTIRVLRAVSLELTAPNGAVDNSVTERQNNVKAALRIQNAGSGTLTVTPRVTKKSGSSAVSVSGVSSKSMRPRSEAVFPVNLRFGAPGDIVLNADATATGANAFNTDSAEITVLEAVQFVYEDDTLSPTLVIPGQRYAFSLALDKNGPDVGVALDERLTMLRFGDSGKFFSARLDSPSDVDVGNQNAVPFTFDRTVVPLSIPDGSFTPFVRVRGTDTNGAVVDRRVGLTDTVLLDRTAPIIRPRLNPPDSQVEGEADATTNGARLNFGGTIQDPDGTPCDDCPISGAVLRQFRGASAIGDIPVTVQNSNGNLTGSYSGNYNDNATAVRLIVNGADGAGNRGGGPSNLVPVDLIAPIVTNALTGGDNDDRRTIVARLSERVATRLLSPSDFVVDNHTTVGASPCGEQTTAGFNCVVLTTGENLGRNEEPVVNYRPTEVNRANDRVGLDLVNQSVTAADGIAPALPVVDSISGLRRQDGQFFSNDSTPDFNITSVTPGDVITVYRDTNRNGTLNPGADEQLGSAQVPPGADSVTVSSRNLGTLNRTFTVFARGVDPRLNVGPAATEILNLDFVAPRLRRADQAVNDVNMAFNDVLVRGRDFAIDWIVREGRESYPVSQVSGSGDTRTVTTDDPSVDEDTNLTDVVYSYKGQADANPGRYQDRAGNGLVNFVGNVS